MGSSERVQETAAGVTPAKEEAPARVQLTWRGGHVFYWGEQAFPFGKPVVVDTDTAQRILSTRWAGYFVKE